MRETFAHKGLEAFYLDGGTWGIQAKHASRLGRILDHLEAARDVKDMDAPGLACISCGRQEGPFCRQGIGKLAGRLPIRGRPRLRRELS